MSTKIILWLCARSRKKHGIVFLTRMYIMLYIGIDIGYTNLAIVLVETDDDRTILDVPVIRRIDIAQCSHDRVALCDCKLHHSNHVVDKIAHVFQEYADMFEKADSIIVERQPPCGMTHIESLLLFKFREKTVLISPNSVHKHFKMSHDYDERKKQVVSMGWAFTMETGERRGETINPSLLIRYRRRLHDIFDALLIVRYHLMREKQTIAKERFEDERRRRRVENKCKPLQDLEKFRYTSAN